MTSGGKKNGRRVGDCGSHPIMFPRGSRTATLLDFFLGAGAAPGAVAAMTRAAQECRVLTDEYQDADDHAERHDHEHRD